MKKLAILSVFILSGCFHQDFKTYERYLDSKRLPPVTVAEFPHCQGYGCPRHTIVSLNAKSWNQLGKIFAPPSKSAKQERERIAKAIGLFERKVGPLTHTDVDVGGTFGQTGEGQLDCVDESTNATVYLSLMQKKGWLKFHTIDQPQVRTPFTTGKWPHQTAAITEIKTGARYAVDSWFGDNGKPAHVVPLGDWVMGWKPEGWSEG